MVSVLKHNIVLVANCNLFRLLRRRVQVPSPRTIPRNLLRGFGQPIFSFKLNILTCFWRKIKIINFCCLITNSLMQCLISISIIIGLILKVCSFFIQLRKNRVEIYIKRASLKSSSDIFLKETDFFQGVMTEN